MNKYKKILEDEGVEEAINQILIDHDLKDVDGMACDQLAIIVNIAMWKGYQDASSEAVEEIHKNYTPNK